MAKAISLAQLELHALKGANYTDKKVNALRKDVAEAIEEMSSAAVPDYWVSELDAKADAIQAAMEKAGRNKSAFLWYTDAHWVNGNSKVSPGLLKYLYMNTPMNKVNFGGDIIGDGLLATRKDMKYLYEWREAIKDLPNHHSVMGNHDILESGSVAYENDNYRYAFMIAPEESPDMVMGNGNYYYIDNPSEKTRYLYLAFPNNVHMDRVTQGEFIVEALKTTPVNWHIVAIAHQWWAYGSNLSPDTGALGAWEADVLSVFDAYNARAVRGDSNYFYGQDFTDAKGKVEFCIGGHLHTDYDFYSEGGIPVICTTADANQNRLSDTALDCGTPGTTTEAAVFGIIADYSDVAVTKITVVGVGRGTSRIVTSKAPAVNLFDKNDADVLLTGRFNSSKSAVAYAEGQLVTGYIEAKVGDTFTVVSDKSAKANGYTGEAVIYDTNKAIITMGSQKSVPNSSDYWVWSDDAMTSTLTMLPTFWDTDMSGTAWIRFCVAYNDIGSIVITKS